MKQGSNFIFIILESLSAALFKCQLVFDRTMLVYHILIPLNTGLVAEGRFSSVEIDFLDSEDMRGRLENEENILHYMVSQMGPWYSFNFYLIFIYFQN